MKVVIMAGGMGTRIAKLISGVPKPMITIHSKPILQYQIEAFKAQGYEDIILAVGYLGGVIKEYFGDGSAFGVRIDYIVEQSPLGTAGALYLLKDELIDDFLLINGDIVFDIDIGRFLRFHKQKGGVATLFSHPNSHPYDSGIIVADDDGRVLNWFHKEDERTWYRNRVNAGIHILSPSIFDDALGSGLFRELKKVDLDRDVLKPLVQTGLLFTYDSPEYAMDIGTPDRLVTAADDIRRGKVSARNLAKKQQAIFLDRDGTINRYSGFLRCLDDFVLLPGVAQAIGKVNASNYLAIVITNQPVIARGEMTFEQLREMHNKMETLLGQEGAYINAIYFCPHHPHKGFKGEVLELKIDCACRKPKPGMLLQAAEDFNIDLGRSWMVGDSAADVFTGKAAGCKTALIGGEGTGIGQVETYVSLLSFVHSVLN